MKVGKLVLILNSSEKTWKLGKIYEKNLELLWGFELAKGERYLRANH